MFPKKSIIFLSLISFFLLFYSGSTKNEKNSNQGFISSYDNSKTLDINQINFPMNNTGNINSSSEFPELVTWNQFEGYNSLVYDQGLWVLGVVSIHPVRSSMVKPQC